MGKKLEAVFIVFVILFIIVGMGLMIVGTDPIFRYVGLGLLGGGFLMLLGYYAIQPKEKKASNQVSEDI